MRVLLIRPPVPRHTIGLKHLMICEPLELEYVAAGLNGHHVQIFDMILERNLHRRLREFDPDVVGTSCYINGVNEVKKICRHVKLWKPRCRTIVGGVQAALAPEDFADPAIDAIVLGDGTSIIGELIAAIADHSPLDAIAGLALPQCDNSILRTSPRAYLPDPDLLPLPRRDLVSHLQQRYYYLFHQPVALVKTTWGCWYQCNFCVTWRITGGRPYSRSPEPIVAEIEKIPQREIYIVDDIFLYDPDRLAAISDLLNRRGIKKNFLVYGRADFIVTHQHLLRQWSQLGLKAVIVGLEAVTDHELLEMNKKCTTELNREAVSVLRQNGIDVYASFITGTHYVKSDWDRLDRFIQDNGIYYVNISPQTPMPGSPIWPRCADKLAVPRSAHGLWDLTHPVLPTCTPLREYYRALIRTYARTVLDFRRAARLPLRTRPPVWSKKYLRLWVGAARIYLQLLRAHHHHDKNELKKAQATGPTFTNSACRNLPAAGILRETEGISPVDPFAGYFDRDSSPTAADSLLTNSPAAQRWFRIFRWGVPRGLYTYQQPLSIKSGPYVRIANRSLINASSYDYLGLIGHPAIEAAARMAIESYGTGTGGVRLLTGTCELHRQLESALANFKGVASSITYSSGYVANIAAISALLGPDDLLVVDAHIHRSIVDAGRLAHVPVRTFKHNDPTSLEGILSRRDAKRVLIVVEGLYSMDGDSCPLAEILAVKKHHDAQLMVDEAHSLGVLGATGRGVNEELGIASTEIDIWMGSLSKAIPSNGGFIAGSRELIYYLQHGSAPFMFSAALIPAAAAAALESIQVIRREPERRLRLLRNAERLRDGLRGLGFDIGSSQSPIIPVMIGGDEHAYRTARALYDNGIWATAIVSPAVRTGAARLRLCATAAMDNQCLDKILTAFAKIRPSIPAKPVGCE